MALENESLATIPLCFVPLSHKVGIFHSQQRELFSITLSRVEEFETAENSFSETMIYCKQAKTMSGAV